jgi:isoleucyl-tRNA synthetase
MQEARKNAGLAVSDRVEVRWSASDEELATALREHGDVVATEVLATVFLEAAGDPEQALAVGLLGAGEGGEGDLGLRFWLTKA